MKELNLKTFDYIIVGGGTAGCVLANRLSEKKDKEVLLIEAGKDIIPKKEPKDVLDLFPTSYYNNEYFWPGLKAWWRNESNSRANNFSQARILGGGGTVMGMLALRGTPADFSEWERLGAIGWGWNEVLPYYCKIEKDLDFKNTLHGENGLLPIRRVEKKYWPPLTHAMCDIATLNGDNFIEDMNSDFRDGLGWMPMSNTHSERASSAICYLTSEVRKRKNLTLLTGAYVEKILFSKNQAIGVQVNINNFVQKLYAKEIVISAGSIFSPYILMKSGIGDEKKIREFGIKVISALPGVGCNLQNHPALYLGFLFKKKYRQPT